MVAEIDWAGIGAKPLTKKVIICPGATASGDLDAYPAPTMLAELSAQRGPVSTVKDSSTRHKHLGENIDLLGTRIGRGTPQ